MADKLRAYDCVFNTLGPLAVEFPESFSDDILNAVGRRWNPKDRKFDTMTFLEHQSGRGALCCSAMVAGAAGAGKSLLLHACAQYHGVRVNKPRYIYTTAVDPLGILTEKGILNDCGAYTFSDFEAKTLMNCSLTDENWKGLFSVEEIGSLPARYHVATFQAKIAKLFAVNLDVRDGKVVGGWCEDQGLPWLAHCINGDAKAMAAESNHIQAQVRRLCVFLAGPCILKAETFKRLDGDDDADLALRKKREDEWRAKRRP